MTPAEILYESVRDRVSPLEWAAIVSAWNLIPILRNGEIRGAVMEKDGEVHCHVIGSFQGRTASRRNIADTLGKVIQTYGFATTRILNDGNHEFVKRLGFTETGRDADSIHYRIEGLRHA